jgi:hypothetical protein
MFKDVVCRQSAATIPILILFRVPKLATHNRQFSINDILLIEHKGSNQHLKPNLQQKTLLNISHRFKILIKKTLLALLALDFVFPQLNLTLLPVALELLLGRYTVCTHTHTHSVLTPFSPRSGVSVRLPMTKNQIPHFAMHPYPVHHHAVTLLSPCPAPLVPSIPSAVDPFLSHLLPQTLTPS